MSPSESSLSLAALAEAIAEKGSQSALAREIGVSQATIWKWLNGLHPVTAEGALSIERVTAVSKTNLRPDLDWGEPQAKTPHVDFGGMEPAR